MEHANLHCLAVRVYYSPMSNWPTADREAVRLLAIEVGVREAARRLGLNEDRVRQWSKRYQWLQSSTPEQQKAIVTTVTKPGDVLLDELSENGKETKLSLSRYAKAQAKMLASKGKLKDHGAFRNIVTGAGTLHGWTETQQAQQFTLNVLNINSLNVEQAEE